MFGLSIISRIFAAISGTLAALCLFLPAFVNEQAESIDRAEVLRCWYRGLLLLVIAAAQFQCHRYAVRGFTRSWDRIAVWLFVISSGLLVSALSGFVLWAGLGFYSFSLIPVIVLVAWVVVFANFVIDRKQRRKQTIIGPAVDLSTISPPVEQLRHQNFEGHSLARENSFRTELMEQARQTVRGLDYFQTREENSGFR